MSAKKPTKKKTTKTKTVNGENVLVLRSCRANLISSQDFQWPSSGPVEAPDWKKTKACGNGLHGFLWGEGNGELAVWEEDAKWLVVEVAKADIIDLDGKVKFPRGVVVFCGAREDAVAYLADRAPKGTVIIGGTATAGYGGTATAGDSGTATAGTRGTATAGNRGTATAGELGVLQLRWFDGNRYRIATFYVGEDGIEPNVAYKLDETHRPIKVEKKTEGGGR